MMNCNIEVLDLDFQPTSKRFINVQLGIRDNEIEVYGPKFGYITSGYLKQVKTFDLDFLTMEVFRCVNGRQQTYVREIWSVKIQPKHGEKSSGGLK